MTLVVAIKTDRAIYMISDAMLSAEVKIGKPYNDISYPTKPNEQSKSLGGPKFVAGLTQKIVTIKEGLFIGWAGDYPTACRFIDFIRVCFERVEITHSTIKSAQADYFAFHPYDLEKISTIIIHENADSGNFFLQGEFLGGPVPNLGDVYVVGSGARAFIRYLTDRAPKRVAAKHGQPPDINIVYYIIDYVISTVRLQHFEGEGIGDGWGGWFEILLKKERGKLKKLDQIMFASMHWEEKDGSIRTAQSGRRFLQYYENDNLFVWSQGRREELRLNVIPPPDQFTTPQRVVARLTSPQLLCLELINQERGTRNVTMLYNLHGHDFCGLAKSIEGSGLAIRIDTQKLSEIIRASVLDDSGLLNELARPQPVVRSP